MFSTLVGQNSDEELQGTALRIVNSLGFTVTIFSIQFINAVVAITVSNCVYMALATGPLLGLIALKRMS